MLKIKIDTKNDAFDYNLTDELKRCLKEAISLLDVGHNDFDIFDTNGNVVGHCKLTNR